MQSLSEHDLLIALLALAIILVLARAMAELARRAGQPEVLGELFAGFLLGPSVLGALLPSLYHPLFLNPAAGTVLSGFSWLGVIFLLLLAGMEVDVAILRQHARPGALAAAFAIIPSLIAGSIFASLVLGKPPPGGVFLGIVLSVTGVSVAAKILMERGEMRRGYAQVILAAGVTSEVVVWLFVSVVSSFHSSSPLLAGALHTGYALAFFLIMVTVGRRAVFWLMRRVQDAAWIINGPVTLVLILTFLAAALTQALGLHALLGAFVIGVLLSQAPRANESLLKGLQSLTLGLFGPIFFALAGMRVDILKLNSVSAIAIMVLLLAVATVVKVGMSAIGARLGGQCGWEAALVGVGLNLKGGTDVVVAIVGTELGLLTTQAYTMYAVVAILTVLASPVILQLLAGKAPPTEEEQARLEAEEAARRSYVPKIERVLVPIGKQVFGSLAASVVEHIANSKHDQQQIFDITQLDTEHNSQRVPSQRAEGARRRLQEASNLGKVQVAEQKVESNGALEKILEASQNYDLVAIGAHPPRANGALSLGDLQDAIIDEAEADVLVVIDDQPGRFDADSVHCILVPTSGLGYSMAAGDIAGSLAEACHAKLVLFHVVSPSSEATISGENEEQQLIESASGVLDELAFRIGRLGVEVEKRVRVGRDAGDEILRELGREHYDLVVMGGVDRGHDKRVYLGGTIQAVLAKGKLPSILLVGHEGNGSA